MKLVGSRLLLIVQWMSTVILMSVASLSPFYVEADSLLAKSCTPKNFVGLNLFKTEFRLWLEIFLASSLGEAGGRECPELRQKVVKETKCLLGPFLLSR